MPAFKKLRLKQYAHAEEHETAEARFWKKFVAPREDHLAGPASCIHFNPSNPRVFAVTASVRVSIYDAVTNRAQKAVSRFKDVAYSGQFRHDGKLIAAGDGEGFVKIFDVASKSMLRQLKFHTLVVESVRWMQDSLHLVSGSDDGRCCYWDMTAGTAVAHFGEHTDNVKRVVASPISPHVFASGSYDHTVKLWDARQPSGAASTFTLTHDAPVEELLWLPAGSLLLAASGNVCRVHDLLAGGRVVHEFSSHQKNVSAITLDGTATRILTADLSGLVKVHHAHTFEVVHGFRYNAPVTSIALSQDNKKLVAGMVDGSLSIRTRKLKASEEEEDETEEFATIRRNRSVKAAAAAITAAAAGAAGSAGAQNDVTVEAQRRARLKPYEKSLKKFKYQETLDNALATRNPVVVVTVLEELATRQGLTIALSGRDEVTLEPLLSFICRYLSNPRYTRLLVDVAHRVLDLYGGVVGQSDSIDELFHKLATTARSELAYQREINRVMGAIDCLVAAASSTVGQKRPARTPAAEGDDDL